MTEVKNTGAKGVATVFGKLLKKYGIENAFIQQSTGYSKQYVEQMTFRNNQSQQRHIKLALAIAYKIITHANADDPDFKNQMIEDITHVINGINGNHCLLYTFDADIKKHSVAMFLSKEDWINGEHPVGIETDSHILRLKNKLIENLSISSEQASHLVNVDPSQSQLIDKDGKTYDLHYCTDCDDYFIPELAVNCNCTK